MLSLEGVYHAKQGYKQDVHVEKDLVWEGFVHTKRS